MPDNQTHIDRYAHLGWRVTPACNPAPGGTCGCGRQTPHTGPSIGKATILPGEKQLTHAARVFRRKPNANVALLLDASSLVSVDCDGSAATMEATANGLPPTPTLTSRPGHQASIYALPPGVLPADSSGRLIQTGTSGKIDILARGIQILPPSVHRIGTAYTWLPGRSPDDVPVAPAPAWVIDALVNAARRTSATATDLPDDLPPVDLDTLDLDEDIRDLIRNGGDRDDRSRDLFRVEVALIDADYDDATIAAILLDPANGISEKPLEQGRTWLAGEIARVREKYALVIEMLDDEPTNTAPSSSGPWVWRRASLVPPRRMHFLWYPVIPCGMFILHAGEPGTGKNTVWYDIIARLSRGDVMPDGSPGPGRVVKCGIITMEDDYETVVSPRLVAAGADLDQIVYGPPIVEFPRHLPQFEASLRDRTIELLFIDPLAGVVDETVDTNVDASIRNRVLTPITQVALTHNVTVVFNAHFNKNTREKNVLKRISASGGIVATPRSVTVSVEDPDCDYFQFRQEKANYVKKSTRFQWCYEIESVSINIPNDPEPLETSRARWIGPVFDVEGADNAQSEQAPSAPKPPKPTAAQRAAADLADILRDGPKPGTDVEGELLRKGHRETSIASACKMLNVRKTGSCPGKPSIWSLPGNSPTSPGADQHVGAEAPPPSASMPQGEDSTPAPDSQHDSPAEGEH